MRFFIVVFVGLLISTTSFAQKNTNGQKMISAIEKKNFNKNEVLGFYEKKFKALAQRDLPGFKVSSVKIDRKTGELSVKGTNAKGQLETLSGMDVHNRSTTSSNKSMGWWECFWNLITFHDCNEEAQVPPPSKTETEEERKAREAHNSMMWE